MRDGKGGGRLTVSIYPVPLGEWFKVGTDERDTCNAILKYEKCCVCGKKPRTQFAYADHSLPWGVYRDVWCSLSCFEKGAPTPRKETVE